jgi:hypothetical protein
MATSLFNGLEIKKLKVMPRGMRACMNPKKRGIAEQLQKGVITPKKAANRYSNP